MDAMFRPTCFLLLGLLSIDLFPAGQGDRDAVVIPVVFHIIHMDGNENISNAQIADAMRILNEDFNRENPDWTTVVPEFLDIVADVGIEFRLAHRDPDGNCTNGITRTRSALTHMGNDLTKSLIHWPSDQYLNVWVSRALDSIITEYSTSPWMSELEPDLDGIVMRHTYLGSIGTGSFLGINRSLTRAVGRWLGLLSTWGTGLPTLLTNCDQDDGIEDTPNTTGHGYCDLDVGTCGSVLDNVENFMEATYCRKMFTEGQKARMLETLNSNIAQRDQLWTAENLAATGVFEELELCSVEFLPAGRSICSGGNVVFTDISSGPVAQRNWLFPGGTPNTSTDSIVTVIYEEPGTYDVTLTVSDGTTELSTTEQAVVMVSQLPGMAVPIEEGLESDDPLSDLNWTVIDPFGSVGFVVTSTTSFTGEKSLVLHNWPELTGEWAELISAPIDLSNETSIRIAYRYAYAQRIATDNDKLLIYASSDCGSNWYLKQELNGDSLLNTGGLVSGEFVPDISEWAYTEVSNFSNASLQEDFRLKFQFQSDGGNHLYLDDININGSPVGLHDRSDRPAWMKVIPNPASSFAQIEMNLHRSQQIQLHIVDLNGQVLIEIHQGKAEAGDRFSLPIEDLTSGIYMIRCITETGSQNTKLIVL